MGFSIGSLVGAIAPAVGTLFGTPISKGLGQIVGGAALAIDPPRQQAAAAVGRATQPGPVTTNYPNQAAMQPIYPTSTVPTPGAPMTTYPPVMHSMAARVPTVARRAGDLIAGTGLGYLFGGNGYTNGAGRSPVQQILAQARAATGGPVTRNKIIDAAKTCGLEVAAQTFGLAVPQVCQVVVKGRTRRRRGISAADIRRTKRTIHFANKIRKDLKSLSR